MALALYHVSSTFAINNTLCKLNTAVDTVGVVKISDWFALINALFANETAVVGRAN